MNKAYHKMTEFERAAYTRARHEAYYKAIRHRKEGEEMLYPNLGKSDEPTPVVFSKLNHLLPAAKEMAKRLEGSLKKELQRMIEGSQIQEVRIWNYQKVYHHSFLEV